MSDTTITLADLKEVSDLPQWAQDKIAEANAEAAKYRVEKKDAVEAGKAEVEAEWSSKFEALESQIQDKESAIAESRTEVSKLKAALETGIESDKVMTFASLLKGDTEDELKAHADEVKQLFAAQAPASDPKDPPRDPSQGSGNPLPLNGDPLLNAVMGVLKK